MNNPKYMNKPDAIVAAAWDGLADLVEKLIDSGVNINIQDETGQTALIAASDQGYFGIVELLLKRGADSNIKDKDGDSALDIAHLKDHAEIVRLLIAYRAERKNGPSTKEQTWDQIYDDFERGNAIKNLVSKTAKKKKGDNMENGILKFSDKDDEISTEVKTRERRVYSDKSDRSIYELFRQYQRGNLELQPEYQRLQVWDGTKQSRLVESVFLEVPIPIIYLSEESDGKFSVIDGQQRLYTFFKFIKNELKLNNLVIFTELTGKKFQDIPKDIQDKFESSTLRIIEIRKESDPDVKFEIFERLNTGAVPLNSQELRNCIYRGKYNELLKDLSEDKDFQFLLGLNGPHYRMYDRELILRFFAFYRNTERNYKPSMKQFLNKEMEQHRHLDNDEEHRLRKLFRKSVKLSKTVFGDKAFRRFMKTRDTNGKWEANKINKALFDVAMYGFTRYEESQIVPNSDSIREGLIHLMTNDDNFLDAISTYTDNKIKIEVRFEKWLSELKEIVTQSVEPRSFDLQYKKQLWETDPTCTICGQRIHLIDDGEIDHIDHYWCGGKTIPSNARLTHRFCNRARNHKIDSPGFHPPWLIGGKPKNEGSNSETPDYVNTYREMLKNPDSLPSRMKKYIDQVGSITWRDLKKECVQRLGCKSPTSGSIWASLRVLALDGYVKITGRGEDRKILSTREPHSIN